MARKFRVQADERGGFDGVRRPSDGRCVLNVQPNRQSPTPKVSPFANAPIQTGGFGGTLNNCGYGGFAPSRSINSAWQIGADRKRFVDRRFPRQTT